MTFFARGPKWAVLGANGFCETTAPAPFISDPSAIEPRPTEQRLEKCRRVICSICCRVEFKFPGERSNYHKVFGRNQLGIRCSRQKFRPKAMIASAVLAIAWDEEGGC